METEIKLENLFIIAYGLGGSFGGARNFEVVFAESEDDAALQAFEKACEEYESYEGMYGLRTVSEIIHNETVDEEEAIEIYEEEREGWLVYNSFPYSKEQEKKAKQYHYFNPFKHITDNILS